jgi:hypothetical protein
MRRLLVVSACALLAAFVLPGTALATHSNGQGPDKDFISGAANGTVPTPCGNQPAHFEANGQSDVAVTGAFATGHFFTRIFFDAPCLSFTEAYLTGDILCVNAFTGAFNPPGANGAVWRGVITQSDPNIPGILSPGMGVLSRHIDNGEGADDPPDRAIGFPTPPPGPGPINCPSTELSTTPVVQGNLVVHDGV